VVVVSDPAVGNKEKRVENALEEDLLEGNYSYRPR
jgi:hypothetical protein